VVAVQLPRPLPAGHLKEQHQSTGAQTVLNNDQQTT
jgi:hypothetical protein